MAQPKTNAAAVAYTLPSGPENGIRNATAASAKHEVMAHVKFISNKVSSSSQNCIFYVTWVDRCYKKFITVRVYQQHNSAEIWYFFGELHVYATAKVILASSDSRSFIIVVRRPFRYASANSECANGYGGRVGDHFNSDNRET